MATKTRSPQQERSRAKVDAILDAADELVADGGADALTTTRVAEHVGIAVGTLYQYFDGVPAILDALIERHAQRFGEHLEVVLAGRRMRRKRDAANAALDALIEYYRDEPAFRALWRTAPSLTSVGIAQSGDLLVDIIVTALRDQQLIVEVDEDFTREAQVQWAIAAALIQVAFAREADGDPAVLAHLRRLFDLDVRPVAAG